MREILEYKYSSLDVDEINRLAKEDAQALVDRSEAYYHDQLDYAVQQILDSHHKYRVVLLAGPSASGKTTTAHKLADRLENKGVRAHVVSMDNYYRGDGYYPLLEDGTEDFESVYALDLEMIKKNFDELLTQSRTVLPIFDFETRARQPEGVEMVLGKNDIVIIEGIHALNPLIMPGGNEDRFYRIFVSARSKFIYRGEKIISPKNLRLIRRMVRDSKFRNFPAERTLDKWDSVCAGERKYIYPFRDAVNLKIDTTHEYEPCVFHTFLIDSLQHVTTTDRKKLDKIEEILDIFDNFKKLDISFIPKDSLLREFIG